MALQELGEKARELSDAEKMVPADGLLAQVRRLDTAKGEV